MTSGSTDCTGTDRTGLEALRDIVFPRFFETEEELARDIKEKAIRNFSPRLFGVVVGVGDRRRVIVQVGDFPSRVAKDTLPAPREGNVFADGSSSELGTALADDTFLKYVFKERGRDQVAVYCEHPEGLSEDGRRLFEIFSVRIAEKLRISGVLRSDHDRQLRIRRQREACKKMIADRFLPVKDVTLSLNRAVNVLATSLDVQRVQIWIQSEDDSIFRCIAYDSVQPPVTVISMHDFPHYFSELRTEGGLVAQDARRDIRLHELIDSYALPLQTRSLMDTGIFGQGRMIGFIRVIQTEELRNWSLTEELYTDTIAAFVSQVLTGAEFKRKEAELLQRLSYESLVSHIAISGLDARNLDAFLEDAIRNIGPAMRVSRAYVFMHRHKTDTMDNTNEWCADGIEPQKDILQEIPSRDVKWWMKTLRYGGTIRFSDIENIPDNGAKEILRAQGILSLLVVPIFVRNLYVGFVGLDDCLSYRDWSPSITDFLHSVAQIIAGVMDRFR
jgi:GAF domain-containing protein